MPPKVMPIKKTAAESSSAPVFKRKSRAVIRDVEAGSSVDCSCCGTRVKFEAKRRNKQVICNVYKKGKWDRVEHFHYDCYIAAGQPYGTPDDTPSKRQRQMEAAAQRGRELVAAS